MEAWHSEPFRRLRRANLTEDVAGTVCEKCLAYDECESKPQPVTLMRCGRRADVTRSRRPFDLDHDAVRPMGAA